MNEIDVVDVLNRIKCCVDDAKLRLECGFIPKGSTLSQIFHGTYDVWETALDGPIHQKVMSDRLNQAKDLGLIMNESGKDDWGVGENWRLTPTGEIFLGQRQRGKTEDFEFLKEETRIEKEAKINIKQEVQEEMKEIKEVLKKEIKQMALNEMPRQGNRPGRPYYKPAYNPPKQPVKQQELKFETMPDTPEEDLPSES